MMNENKIPKKLKQIYMQALNCSINHSIIQYASQNSVSKSRSHTETDIHLFKQSLNF